MADAQGSPAMIFFAADNCRAATEFGVGGVSEIRFVRRLCSPNGHRVRRFGPFIIPLESKQGAAEAARCARDQHADLEMSSICDFSILMLAPWSVSWIFIKGKFRFATSQNEYEQWPVPGASGVTGMGAMSPNGIGIEEF
jgi:hypothetical protein